jgi:hypothetical protein
MVLSAARITRVCAYAVLVQNVAGAERRRRYGIELPQYSTVDSDRESLKSRVINIAGDSIYEFGRDATEKLEGSIDLEK